MLCSCWFCISGGMQAKVVPFVESFAYAFHHAREAEEEEKKLWGMHAAIREEEKWGGKVKGSESVPLWRYLLFLCICTWSLALEGTEIKSTLTSAPRLN